MIDAVQIIDDANELQRKQSAARDTGNVITIRVQTPAAGCGPILEIDTNHPALLIFDDETSEFGYHLTGGLVHSLTGICPSTMTPIEDLAREGITELRIAGDGGTELVIPIPKWSPPEA